MISVFIDTFVILNLTVFAVLTTDAMSSGKDGTALTQAAFMQSFGNFGSIFIAILPAVLRIFDDSGMAFLWPDECEISVRRGRGKGLFLHRCDLYCHWFYVKGKFSMGSGRFLQRADGYSERFGITCIESCGCGG